MTIVQQIQFKRHISDTLRRRGVKLGMYPEYERRVYNIYMRVWQAQQDRRK